MTTILWILVCAVIVAIAGIIIVAANLASLRHQYDRLLSDYNALKYPEPVAISVKVKKDVTIIFPSHRVNALLTLLKVADTGVPMVREIKLAMGDRPDNDWFETTFDDIDGAESLLKELKDEL